MFSKIFILFAALALFIQIAVATPPACVLKAVNAPESSPGNVKGICESGSSIKQALVSDCGSNFDAAMSAFFSICSSAGVTMSTWDVASPSTTLASSNSAGTSSTASSVMTTSDINSGTTATSVPDGESASSTESVSQSTHIVVTTATNTTDYTTTARTASQASDTSAATTPSGAAPTGAAGRVETSGMAIGAIAAAAGVMLAL